MNVITTHIIDLKKSITLLVNKYIHVKKVNENLEKDKNNLVKKNQDLEEKIKELKKKVEMIDVVKGIGFNDGSSVELAKKRVNSHIREVDKCMCLLNE